MQSTDPGGPTGQTSPDQMKSTYSWEATKTWMVRWRGSRQLVLVIVAIALLLDNMLLTVVGKCIITVYILDILVDGNYCIKMSRFV